MTTEPRSLFVTSVRRLDKDERFTPPWLFAALSETFDLDVAAPIEGGDYVPALARFTRKDDGRVQPWHGFVWCNPPFSELAIWSERFIEHGNGLFLGPISNSKWGYRMAEVADRWLFMRDFAFSHPTHAGRRSSMPLVLAAMGDRAASAVDRSNLPGINMRRVTA